MIFGKDRWKKVAEGIEAGDVQCARRNGCRKVDVPLLASAASFPSRAISSGKIRQAESSLGILRPRDGSPAL